MAIEQVKEAIRKLLESGNIGQAIYIDDVFAFRGNTDVEQALGWFAEALTKSQEKTLALVEVPYPAPDEDIWRVAFRMQWEQFSVEEQTKIIDLLSEILNSQLTKDKEIASQLKHLFPEKFDYREIPPSVWVNKKSEILADVSKGSRTLLLFDQDLSAESGFTERGASSGGGLLKELIDSDDELNILCGILSHTIGSIESEYEYHKGFATEYQIGELDRRKYLPLAKSRLSEPLKFADGFKKLLLHELGETIKESTLAILDTAHKTAIEKVQSLDIYAFERMIFKAAHQANEWEIETLVRLFQIYQRNDVRLKLADVSTAASLCELIDKARPTSQIETVIEEHTYPRVREIRTDELYEKSEHIKHRPIETGDIFVCDEGTGKERYFILLAQPCDLAVRLQGSRVQQFVSLVPIAKINSHSSKKKVVNKLEWRNYWSTRTIIDNFFSSSQELAILEFKDAVAVKTAVLDLAVLSSEGYCKIDIHNNTIPSHLTEGWKVLAKNWLDYYTQIDTKLQTIREVFTSSKSDEIPDEFWEIALPEFSFPPVLPKAVCTNGVFDFGLRRVKRYRQPGANGLLKAFTQFLSREAKEFDFSD